jgi:hypothetical protein
MPKNKAKDPPENQDIISESDVRVYLENHGIPLELYTADIFSEFKFQRFQSVYYHNYELNKMRELDVICYEPLSSKFGSPVFQFYIECKMSPKNATLLFCDPQEIKKGNRFRLIYNEDNSESDNDGAIVTKVRAAIGSSDCDFFDGLGPQSYNLRTAKNHKKDKEEDIAYSAAESVCYSAASSNATVPNDSPFPFPGSIVLPIIVIDGPMFSCSRNKDTGGLDISSIEMASLLWKRRVLNQPVFTIQVITKNGLTNYCEQARGAVDNLKRNFLSQQR